MKAKRFFLFISLALLWGCALQIASMDYSKKSSRFSSLKAELDYLSQSNPDNQDVADLAEMANDIMETNTRCGTISLTDTLDRQCEFFYSTILPEFEKKYSQVSGDILMGRLTVSSNVKGRVGKVNACVDALGAFYISPAGLLAFNQSTGFYNFIPLDAKGRRFKADYEFLVELDRDAENQLNQMAKQWLNECWEDVHDIDKTFLDIFIEGVDILNDQKRKQGSHVTLRLGSIGGQPWIDHDEYIAFFLDMPSLIGTYYLNGKELFKGEGQGNELSLIGFGEDKFGRPMILQSRELCYGQPCVRTRNECFGTAEPCPMYKSIKPEYYAKFEGTIEGPSNVQVKGSWIWNY